MAQQNFCLFQNNNRTSRLVAQNQPTSRQHAESYVDYFYKNNASNNPIIYNLLKNKRWPNTCFFKLLSPNLETLPGNWDSSNENTLLGN
ncbi:hypothetical protein A1353_03300 [Methylomonas methanica]|uniref:Uncharacterized protein n=1 Tax=Methylomonas methanica TaxID=421 RepID=A0A177LT77_METMH|nr:hypothetical protein A1353_03300 [Methylomonas methanica]